MEKITDIFDRLNNTIGNHMEDKATDQDLIKIAYEVDKYLLEHPHPHDQVKNHVSDCPYEAYAVFCIECDRQGIKPIKHKDFLALR